MSWYVIIRIQVQIGTDGRGKNLHHFTSENKRFQRMPVYGSLVNHTSTALPTT